MSKKLLVPIEGLSADTQSLYEVLNDEADLSVVLVGASYLDACLAALLERFFIDSAVVAKLLDSKSGALGSFNARADVCYCLGLIKKNLYQDLLVIAEIRNLFAHHHLALTFSDSDVGQKCQQLSYVAALRNGSTDEPILGEALLEHPRNRYVLTAVLISQRLLVTGLGVRHVEPKA